MSWVWEFLCLVWFIHREVFIWSISWVVRSKMPFTDVFDSKGCLLTVGAGSHFWWFFFFFTTWGLHWLFSQVVWIPLADFWLYLYTAALLEANPNSGWNRISSAAESMSLALFTSPLNGIIAVTDSFQLGLISYLLVKLKSTPIMAKVICDI